MHAFQSDIVMCRDRDFFRNTNTDRLVHKLGIVPALKRLELVQR